MTTRGFVTIAIALSVSAPAIAGPWNEAVRIDNGRRVVELPSYGRNDPQKFPPERPSSWDNMSHGHIIETDRGLVECVEAFVSPGACIPYIPGQNKRMRAWIVKQRGAWMQCPERESNARCVELYNASKPHLPPYKVQ
jgi:hypothetical protein